MSLLKTEFGGYFSEAVLKNVAQNSDHCKKLKLILNKLSYFKIDGINQSNNKINNEHSCWAVFYNIIQRGLPTRLSYDLENKIASIFNIYSEDQSLGGCNLIINELSESLQNQLVKAYYAIDSRKNNDSLSNAFLSSWEKLDSEYEENFLKNVIPKFCSGNDYLIQLIQPQRPIEDIIDINNCDKNVRKKFVEQRVDFAIEFPYIINNHKGIVIEIDGPHHKKSVQQKLDIARDEVLEKAGWAPTIRIPTDKWREVYNRLRPLQRYLSDNYFKNLAFNKIHSIGEDPNRIKALQLVLTPILIGRIQKCFIKLIQLKVLDTKEASWNIAIIERDVPGGYLAINDLIDMMNHYSKLIDNPANIPKINLNIFSSNEFLSSELHSIFSTDPKEISSTTTDKVEYDLVLDTSVLSYCKHNKSNFAINPKNYVNIHSVSNYSTIRKFQSKDTISFKPLTSTDAIGNHIENEELKIHLEYFLQSFFRKSGFRPGQLPILNRVLQHQSVIGLLPTGGGKSLTYQLATLLQPGISIIVDPIKSLMRDQVNSLIINQLDCSGFINSSLKRKDKERVQSRLSNGELLFIFVSPERLLIQKFREGLKTTAKNGFYFTYCVIDEAHCVSEWGHDFRTSYLFLGRNAISHCPTHSGKPLTLFGLTATASYDVLADIQRELSDNQDNINSILSDEAIIRFETFNRPELQYNVIEVDINSDVEDVWGLKRLLGLKKHETTVELIDSISQTIGELNRNKDIVYVPITEINSDKDEEENILKQIQIPSYSENNFWSNSSSIVFCPHRSWFFGVTDKYKKNPQALNGTADYIKSNLDSDISTGTFIGVDNNQKIEEDNQLFQDSFIEDNLDLMVCTKAFGMGIDKPNVRMSIHLNYPQSLESFVQESGRIGRDGKIALANIVYNRQMFDIEGELPDYNVDRQILNDFYNKSFPGQDKEKWILQELLLGIEGPAIKKLNELSGLILEEEGITLNFNIQSNQAGTSKYITVRNSQNQSCGILFIPSLNPRTNYIDVDIEEANNILSIVKNMISNTIPDGADVEDWLTTIEPEEDRVGIEHFLSEMDHDEEKEIIIYFTNDIPSFDNSVKEILKSTFNNWEFKKVYKEYLNTSSILDFLDKYSDITDQNKKRIENCFFKKRTKSDTEKALYRLALIGVVKDYYTNYANPHYVVTIIKRSDKEHRQYLKSYIRRYYSDIKTENIINQISERRGENYIQKSLNYIIDFLYKEVAEKRWKAIDAMVEACNVGLEDGNRAIKEYIDVYFNSKYGKSGYTFKDKEDGEDYDGSLIDRTDGAKESSFDFVIEFINIATEWDTSGAQLVNLKHLRGATIRLLISNPKNFSLLLLKAFCTLILEDERISSSRHISEAEKEIMAGYDIYFNTDKPEMTDLISNIFDYFKLINNNSMNSELKKLSNEFIEKLVLNQNTNWLKQFNNNFLESYG